MTAKELKEVMKKGGINDYEHLLFMAYLTYVRQAKEDENDFPMLSKIEWDYATEIRSELLNRGFFQR